MAAAAQNLCPVTLELGGKSPAIVCDDFPLQTAAERILFVKLLNAGQICTTVDHAWLPEAKVASSCAGRRPSCRQRYPSLDSPGLHLHHRCQRAFERLLRRWTRPDPAARRWCSWCPARPSTRPRARSRRMSC
jgi:coniferyl-aldehyde dehydrogenase